MNKIFAIVLIVASLLLLFFNPSNIMDAMILGSEKSIDLALSLISVYAVWLSLLELVGRTKLDEKLKRLLRPILQKLFGKMPAEAENQISINISSNMLGLGNAATPSGIKAMQELDPKTGRVTKQMILLMILNTCAIQIIPSTVIGLRVSAGSLDASSILLPTIITSFASTILAVSLVLLIEKIKQRRKK